LTEEKYTIEQVADIANEEGVDYAIQHYMSGDSIEDPQLAEMWDDCRRLINKIERYIAAEMRKKDPDWEWE
jgi:hypothetical protein